MNVASLELCKELYGLSGWDDTEMMWAYTQNGWVLIAEDDCNSEYPPAYDLGYLLRKLQENDLTVILRWNRDMGGRIAMKGWDGKYCIGTFDMPQGEYPVADIPEDAACLLAIQLFQEGLLTKEVI